MIAVLLLFLFGFVFSYLAIPFIVKYALNHNLIDIPDARKLHQNPIPALGGIALYGAVLLSSLIFPQIALNQFSLTVLIASGLLLAIGVRDDVQPMKAGVKLAGQIAVAAIIIYFADVRIISLYGIFDIYTLPVALSYFVSLIVILLFINSMNLIDGINGLAACLAIVFFVFFALYFYPDSSFLFSACIVLIGALLAFLRYNLIRPKIFMGDSGSMNMGLFASILCINIVNVKNVQFMHLPIHAPYGLILCIFIIPLFDTMRVFFIRLLKLKSPFSPDKKHIHHLLLRLGLEHYHITGLLVLVNLIYISFGLLFQEMGDMVLIIAVLASCVLGILIVEFLIKKRIKEGPFKMPFYQTIYQLIYQNWFWFVCIIAFSLPFMRRSSSIPIMITFLFWLITFQWKNFKFIKINYTRIVHFNWIVLGALLGILVFNQHGSAEAAYDQLFKLALFSLIPLAIQSKSHQFYLKYYTFYLSFFLAGVLTFCGLSFGIMLLKQLIFSYNAREFSEALFTLTDLSQYSISLFLIIAVLFVLQLKRSSIIILRNHWINSSIVLFLLIFQFFNHSFFAILVSIVVLFIFAVFSLVRYKDIYLALVFLAYIISIGLLDGFLFHGRYLQELQSLAYLKVEPMKEVCWNASINLILQNPITGIGTDYKAYLLAEINKIQYYDYEVLSHLNCYNQFFEYWLKYGVFGVIGILGLFGYFFYVSILKRDIYMFFFNLVFFLFNFFESFFEAQSSIVLFVLTNCFFLLKINKLKIHLNQKTVVQNFKRFVHINYVLFDFIGAALAWMIFFTYRKTNEIPQIDYFHDILSDMQFITGTIAISLFWLVLYFYFGFYSDIQKKSRFTELTQTIVASIIGAVLIFFIVIVDDKVPNFKFYYKYFIFYLAIHFVFTFFFKYINIITYRFFLRSNRIHYNSIIVGNKEKIKVLYEEIGQYYKGTGKSLIGYISEAQVLESIDYIGNIKELKKTLELNQINEVVLAYDTSNHKDIFQIISQLSTYNVDIKITPDLFDIVSNSLKTNAVMGPLLIEIDNEAIPLWQKNIKYTIDYFVATVALIFFLPLFFVIAILIKLDSAGSIFYYQERIGFDGKKFNIIKFRSMRMNAEEAKPLLSSDHDTRITKVGKVLRKWRLDELPQFINILKGEMSLIGYRAEREYFIKQIIEKNPHYQFLYKIKPGITSMGMINFGYAENLDQMLDRLKYDLVYLKNMSLSLDFKIFIYTIIILFEGRGK